VLPPVASPPNATNTTRLLETIGQLAQISLAIVAIFGYFYTVQPVYQKELLAEQVAEYDSIIKKQTPKIAEIELRLGELQREREQLSKELQTERVRMGGELKSIERQLSAAREEKKKIESQIQFMTFRYHLPDGTPAVTSDQVKTAQVFNLRKSFLSAIQMSCTFSSSGNVFLSYSYAKADGKNKVWPFTESEINTWNEHGSRYPLKYATECLDSVASQFSKQYGQNYSTEIESLRKEAIQYANRAGAKTWTPPIQPADLLEDLAAKRPVIQSEMVAELKKNEEEYGDWESTFGEARRVLFKHNYEVGKKNAEMRAYNKRVTLEYEMQEKANSFRKSIHAEIKRLIMTESRVDSK
jgi:hypothetical protein